MCVTERGLGLSTNVLLGHLNRQIWASLSSIREVGQPWSCVLVIRSGHGGLEGWATISRILFRPVKGPVPFLANSRTAPPPRPSTSGDQERRKAPFALEEWLWMGFRARARAKVGQMEITLPWEGEAMVETLEGTCLLGGRRRWVWSTSSGWACLIPVKRILEHLEGLGTCREVGGKPDWRIWEAGAGGTMKTRWASLLESIEAAKELEVRENHNEKAAWNPLSSHPHRMAEEKGEGGEGQGQSLDIERFDSGVKGTAGKATGTSGRAGLEEG